MLGALAIAAALLAAHGDVASRPEPRPDAGSGASSPRASAEIGGALSRAPPRPSSETVTGASRTPADEPRSPVSGAILGPDAAAASARSPSAPAVVRYPAPPSGPAGGIPPSPALLAEQARGVAAISLAPAGEVEVAEVRRRLAALEALTAAAQPFLRGGSVDDRLAAHWEVAEGWERFAAELFSARSPRRASAEAARPWAEQIEWTVERAAVIAAAHLRSCRALAEVSGTRPEAGRRCAESLARVTHRLGPESMALATGGTGEVRARLSELQPCFDRRARERPEAGPLEITARLSLDALGRVESASVRPASIEERPLYDCLIDGLVVWVLPGLGDTEIELPLRIEAGR